MAWHYSATPDQVQPELGPDLLVGDYSAANPSWTDTAGTYSVTGGGRLALTVGDPHLYLALTPDAVYTATVEVRGAATVSWDMTLQNPDGDQVVLPVGDVDATPTDDWVTVRADWRAPLDPLTGSPAVTATGPGTVEIRNPVMAVQTGRVILTVPGDVLAENIMASGGLIAGDPAGAHLELKGTGLHAYDATGTETAHISGAEGVFVGGEFRTSDALPGQVVFADDAYEPSWAGPGQVYPGIGVTPISDSATAIPPGIGSYGDGVIVDGGKSVAGGSSYIVANPQASFMRTHREDGTTGGVIQASPAASLMRTYNEGGTLAGEVQVSPAASYMRTYREDGGTGGVIQAGPDRSIVRTYSGNSSESGWVRVQPRDAELAYVAPNNTYFSQIKADASEAFLYTRAGGANRYLSVDANGVWVKTNVGGTQKSYNLEETAQDSGWQSFPVRSGITANGVGWRNKGGVCHFKGTVSASWTSGWNTIVSGLPAAMTPASDMVRSGASSSTSLILRMSASGTLDVNFPAAHTGSIHLSPLSYVLD